jgi:uncharacterized protein YdcH (DUF465 family)
MAYSTVDAAREILLESQQNVNEGPDVVPTVVIQHLPMLNAILAAGGVAAVATFIANGFIKNDPTFVKIADTIKKTVGNLSKDDYDKIDDRIKKVESEANALIDKLSPWKKKKMKLLLADLKRYSVLDRGMLMHALKNVESSTKKWQEPS